MDGLNPPNANPLNSNQSFGRASSVLAPSTTLSAKLQMFFVRVYRLPKARRVPIQHAATNNLFSPSQWYTSTTKEHAWFTTRPTMLARDMAYLIYTSGSTGTPKGVRCHHQGAMNTNIDLIERFDLTPNDRVLGLSSLSFDLSVFDVFAMSAAGGTLVLPTSRDVASGHAGATGPDPEEWLRLVDAHRITVWNAVPAFMELLVNYVEQVGRRLPDCLRVVMMSGDWIPPTLPERIHRLSPNDTLRVVSLGGATEAAIWWMKNIHCFVQHFFWFRLHLKLFLVDHDKLYDHPPIFPFR